MNDKVIGGQLDLAIDGADEVDPDCNCIKGGGAAHVREKIVEYNAKIFVVIADSSKSVQTIGTDCTWKEPINVPEMEAKINSIVGVVETGLFTQNKPIVFISKEDGSVEIRNLK